MPVFMQTSDTTNYHHISTQYGTDPVYVSMSYEGKVLQVYEKNFYDDSDFYAIVWNGTALEHVYYATTRGWTYCNGASVDATPEVLAQVAEYLTKCYTQEMMNLDVAQHEALAIGKEVEVIAGRKIAKGTRGIITGIYPNDYDKENPIVYVDRVKTYAKNLKVVEAYEGLDMAYITEYAAEKAQRTIASKSYR